MFRKSFDKIKVSLTINFIQMKGFLFAFFCYISLVQAQEHKRFDEEVASIQKKYDTLWNASKETIVFTGSSSVRIWKDLQNRFSKYQIVNSGFGGSKTSDLLAYADELILKYKPKKVFIYEGDNDIADRIKLKEITNNLISLINTIKSQNSFTQIILISAKPCIARWNLKRKYKQLNRRLKKICENDTRMQFADVWHPMLTNKKPNHDIFLSDGLHMNAKGYAIWYDVLKVFVENKK